MKKILIVNASKRRKGNSYALEQYVIDKIKDKAEVVDFRIGEKGVRVCLGCDACKRKDKPNCVQKDDFTALIPEIDSCDAMLILSPVYWEQFPAQLKAFLDRTYSFMSFSTPDLSMATRKDKKIAGYFFCGVGPVDVYSKMVENNLKSFTISGFTESKAYVAGNVNEPGSVMNNSDYIQVADSMIEWILK
ncbi:flavodoxin family protein [bacterium]|nr:flavodoxin family protein [bacterium]